MENKLIDIFLFHIFFVLYFLFLFVVFGLADSLVVLVENDEYGEWGCTHIVYINSLFLCACIHLSDCIFSTSLASLIRCSVLSLA